MTVGPWDRTEVGIAYRKRYHKEMRINFPSRYLWICAKQKSRKKNLDFNLDVEDIVIPETCPVLGISILINIEGGRMNDNSPTLDRLDNTKGYVKGNIHVMSWRANRLKYDGTSWEFRRLVQWLENVESEKNI